MSASSSSSSSSPSSEPPTANPVLTAYDGFVEKTPFVTRHILTAQFVSYLISWFMDPHFALSNMLNFTIFKLEVYRLVLSPLVNNSFLALLFAYISFSDHGKRLELSMGSTSFGWLCFMIAILTNLVFSLLTLCLYLISSSGTASRLLFLPAEGIWLILFGTVALECVQARQRTNATSHRRLFLAQVPVLYYPAALYLFFAFISAQVSIPYLISLLLGYAIGFGYVDKYLARVLKVQLSAVTVRQYEESWLLTFTRRTGWISGQEVLGSGAWSDLVTAGGNNPNHTSATGGGHNIMVRVSKRQTTANKEREKFHGKV